jgi:HSP20 family protein
MYHDPKTWTSGNDVEESLRKENSNGQSLEVRSPKIDVFETYETYYIRLSLPGVKKENLSIHFNDRGDLEIKGKVVTDTPEKLRSVISQEIYQGPFFRTVHIPRSTDKQKLKFNYNNGILEIYIDKAYKGG